MKVHCRVNSPIVFLFATFPIILAFSSVQATTMKPRLGENSWTSSLLFREPRASSMGAEARAKQRDLLFPKSRNTFKETFTRQDIDKSQYPGLNTVELDNGEFAQSQLCSSDARSGQQKRRPERYFPSMVSEDFCVPVRERKPHLQSFRANCCRCTRIGGG